VAASTKRFAGFRFPPRVIAVAIGWHHAVQLSPIETWTELLVEPVIDGRPG
jgi:hypothetical protein